MKHDEVEFGVLGMFSAEWKLPDATLVALAGRHLRILGQEGAAGEKAAKRWTAQLRLVGIHGTTEVMRGGDLADRNRDPATNIFG